MIGKLDEDIAMDYWSASNSEGGLTDILRSEIDFPNERPFDDKFELENIKDLYDYPEGALYITVRVKRGFSPKLLLND